MICGNSEGLLITGNLKELALFLTQEKKRWLMSLNHLYDSKKLFMCGKRTTDSIKDGDFIKQVKCTLLKVTSQSWIWTFMKRTLITMTKSYNITLLEEWIKCGCCKRWRIRLMSTGFTVLQSLNTSWDMMEKSLSFIKVSILYGEYKVTFQNETKKKFNDKFI